MKQSTFYLHCADTEPILHGAKVTVRGRDRDEIERKLSDTARLAAKFGGKLLHWKPPEEKTENKS